MYIIVIQTYKNHRIKSIITITMCIYMHLHTIAKNVYKFNLL